MLTALRFKLDVIRADGKRPKKIFIYWWGKINYNLQTIFSNSSECLAKYFVKLQTDKNCNDHKTQKRLHSRDVNNENVVFETLVEKKKELLLRWFES